MNIRSKFIVNSEDLFVWLLVLVWIRLSLVSYAYQTLLRIPIISSIADFTKIGIYIIAVLGALSYLSKKIRLLDVIFYIIFVSVYIFTIFNCDRTSSYLQAQVVRILLISVPTFFVGLGIEENHIEILHKWSRICMIFILIYTFVIGIDTNDSSYGSANMSYAYRILIHLVILTLFALRERKIIDVILSVTGLILLMLCGNRGAFLAFGVFLVFYILLSYKSNKRFIVVTSILFATLIFCLFDTQILNFIVILSNHLGISTRIVNSLLQGGFLDSHGRDSIASIAMSYINAKPLTGYGIAGDRNMAGTSSYYWSIAYSHNLILEMWISFGYIIGSIIVLAILFCLIKAFIVSNREEREFLLVLIFGGGFLKLLISSSYLIEPLFFLLIGYCISLIRKYKNTINLTEDVIDYVN